MPQTTNGEQWLAEYGDELARVHAAIQKLDRKKAALDIQARTLDRALAKTYVNNRSRLWKELDKIGMSEMVWCKEQGKGNSLSRMRRRMKLLPPKAWRRYLYHRRKTANPDVYGLEYAVVLANLPLPEEEYSETNARQPTRVECANGTLDPDQVNLITDDCVLAMPRMLPQWYHVAITSMPYWPARRLYRADGKPIGFGFEPTFEEWLANQVQVGREMKRVLRDDGVLWVAMDNSIAEPGREFSTQADNGETVNFRVQDATYLRPKGNWLLLPFRYAMEMQDDGWHLRDIIIADKGASGRMESSPTRARHSYEWLFMFTKNPHDYYYDQDALRIPLAQEITAASLIGDGGYLKAGVIRGEHISYRSMGNPIGRPCEAIWYLPKHYHGGHPATFSEELVRRALTLTCPPGGRVLDPFVGSGTVAVVASKLGLQFTGIDLNPRYIEEARQRVLSAHAQSVWPNYEANGTDIRSDLEGQIRAAKRYRGLLVDVPWHAWPTLGKPGAADSHYAVMEQEEIFALRVGEVATDDATLFLWVPHANLEEGFAVMRAWGFENARTGAVRDKIGAFGNGYSFRMQHEHLLVGRRLRTPRHFEDHSISSVIHAPRGLHSEKPPEVHDIIERALGGRGPFLELFGRKHVPGWTVLGNQLPPPDEVHAVAD